MAKLRLFCFALLISAIAATSAFAQSNPFEEFQRLASRICPDRKLAYLVEGAWQMIMLDGEGAAFSPLAEKKLNRSQDHFAKNLHCAESVAVDCFVAARLYAIQSQGFMKRFTRQICKTWRCEDEASCNFQTEASHSRD